MMDSVALINPHEGCKIQAGMHMFVVSHFAILLKKKLDGFFYFSTWTRTVRCIAQIASNGIRDITFSRVVWSRMHAIINLSDVIFFIKEKE